MSSDHVDPELEAAFESFWEADRSSQLERIAVLRRTAGLRSADKAALDEAARIAHGLCGVAAMYRFPIARSIAAQLEGYFARGNVGPDVVLLIDQLEAALAAPYRSRKDQRT